MVKALGGPQAVVPRGSEATTGCGARGPRPIHATVSKFGSPGPVNDEAGIAAMISRLKELQPVLVVMEATGGHEMAAAAAMTTTGLQVAIVNPRRARDFEGGRLPGQDGPY